MDATMTAPQDNGFNADGGNVFEDGAGDDRYPVLQLHALPLLDLPVKKLNPQISQIWADGKPTTVRLKLEEKQLAG